jgi:anti-sigma regulatory factor (Ser/Thr protein kinase)
VTVQAADIEVESGAHAVHFYDRDDELAAAVGRYLIDGLTGGGVGIVIATEAHRGAFAAQLENAGLDAVKLERANRLVRLDAAETMSSFMPGGLIDREAFHRVIGSIVRSAIATGRPVWAFGEMVAVLWDAGDVLAAIELEKLWNELGQELPFSLLCGYPTASVAGSEHAEALGEVCHLHSAVLNAPPAQASPVGGASAEFLPDREAPAGARRLVAETLSACGHNGDLLADAELVVSELATNAIIHAKSTFSVDVSCQNSTVRISVRDGSSLPPTVRDAGPTAGFGRGMRLVDMLSDAWGVDTTATGKVIWAELHG